MPTTLYADAAIVAAQYLVHALQHHKLALIFDTVQLDQAVALSTLSEILLFRAQSAPCPPLVLPLRVRALPVTLIIPPRVPVTSTGPQFPALDPVACQRPSIIEPNDDDPVFHQYHLRPQINLAELLPAQQENLVIDCATGNMHKYSHLARGSEKSIWIKSLANDLGCLVQDVGSRMPMGKNTLYFCHPSQTPSDCKVTYAKLVAPLQLKNKEEHCVRFNVGGNKQDYPGVIATKANSLSTLGLLINIVISTWQAQFLTLDIKDYYYNTSMSCRGYM